MHLIKYLKYVFGITFCLYVALCFYNHPSYDDFTYAFSTHGKTYWEAQVFWYKTWSGRYTATALLTFNPIVFHWFYGYKLLSLAVVLGLLSTIYLLVKTYLCQLAHSEQWFLTLLFAAFYFSLLPHLSGGIYWMAGSMTHAVPTILVGLSLVLMKRKGTNLLLDYVVLPVMTFLIVGSNETIMFTWMTLLLIVNIYVLYRSARVDTVLILLFAVGLAGSLIVISAPGNLVRSKVDGSPPRPLHAFIDSSAYSIVYLLKFGSISFGLLLIWLIKNAKMVQEKMQWYWINRRSLAITSILLIVTQFCTFFPALWATNRRPPKYVYNMSIFFYLPLAMLTVMQLAIVCPRCCKFADRIALNNKKALIIFCLLFVLLGNNGPAIYDVVWGARHYNDQLNMRYDKMSKAVGQDLIVEELRYKPKSLFYADIETDPRSDKNKRYAQYFGLRSITKESVNVNPR
jgi:hypothetical protein